MTKQDSQIIKGIAILLMVFGHLFTAPNLIAKCHCVFYIGDVPLASILIRVTNPVAFFLIVGGYGLYKVWLRGDTHRWTRLIKLYIHYWLSLLLFIPIAHYLNPESYPGNFIKILDNLSGYSPSYCPEMWFLLPYVILSALSPFIFLKLQNIRARWIVPASFLIYLFTSFLISRYGSSYIYAHRWLYIPLVIFHFQFNFLLGAMAARINLFGKLKDRLKPSLKTDIIAGAGIASLVLIHCIFKHLFGYAFAITTLVLLMRLPNWLRVILSKLGKQSMNIWMVHTWLGLYLFNDFFYSFSYPILIFAMVTLASYMVGIVLDAIAKPVESLLLPRGESKIKPII